ncbi:hypothetical protein BpHYR1_013587 [Brachionus plicatilis]|uniref:Uncharacterized protein n=1 Tax=Brachionus plicatilis TaxID=10195 RepID=A0A3M7RRS0_BRAPC|nr:hypothetical protein BpHYR1_013587 [Brachionus plicatilis]
MVNKKTALERITEFISTENLRPMKKWSTRFRSTGSENTSCGGDVLEMLKDVLNKKEKEKLVNNRHKHALKNLATFYRQFDRKKRHLLIRPLRKSMLNFSEIRRLKFPVSRKLRENCLDESERKKGGGNPISKDLLNSIDNFLREHSNVASNRLFLNRNHLDVNYGEVQNARYLEDGISELYKKFYFSNEVGRSTFYKYVKRNGEFKKAFRLTDICDYCEKGNHLKNKIQKYLKILNYDKNSLFDSIKIINDFELLGLELTSLVDAKTENIEENKARLELVKDLLSNLKDYEIVSFHKNIAKAQRIAYNKHHTSFDELKDKIMIEVDFKQKIVIGMSPRQVNSEYYSQISRTCLGFGVYFVSEKNEIETIYFDIIASDLCEDARAVVRGFRILRDQDFFKQIEKKSLIVWMDCGKHFRNCEVVGYLLKDLAKEKIHVNLNFFCEKHGKNQRDSHFSCISRFINAESLKRRLCSTKDIVEAINNGQLKANENSGKNIITIAYELDQQRDFYYSHNFPSNTSLTIQNIESYYNYRTIDLDFNLVTSILSNENQFLELKLRSNNRENITHDDYTVIEEEKIKDSVPNICHLRQKQLRVNCALNKIKENLISNNIETNTEFFNYFTFDSNQINNNDQSDQVNLKPIFCSDKNTRTKKPCNQCTESCSLPIEVLTNPNGYFIGQNDILEELMIH